MNVTDAVSIRSSTLADLPAIEQLLVESKLPTAGVAEMLAADATSFLVAGAPGDDHVGVAGLEVCDTAALLRSVAVRSDWRSRGIGNELVARAITDARSRGLDALFLLTETAEHYFPRFGFERVDRAGMPAAIAETVEFKSACPSSAIAMKKSLR
jgi:amino-acid N-acetyltransferase